jgi:hypothetical protein
MSNSLLSGVLEDFFTREKEIAVGKKAACQNG